MNRRSIRWRLTAWYAAVLAVTFALTGAGVWWAIRDSIHETVDKDLRTRASSMRAYLTRNAEQRRFESLADELAEQIELAPSAIAYRVAGNDGSWVYVSPGTQDWTQQPPDARSLPDKGRIITMGSAKRPYRVLSAPLPDGLVQIGVPVGEYYEMLDHVTWTGVLASPVVLLLASLGGYWMSRRALEPVDRITTAAAEIEEQNLSRRLPLTGADDELDHLSQTLNSMLGRLEASFRRMAQFTADASHELRTPIAIIRMNAEVALARQRDPEEYREVLLRILAETERTTRLIEDLMALTRADAGAAELLLEPVDLAEVIRDRCAEMQVLASSTAIILSTELPASCMVLGDANMLGRLFLILLDNAIRYTPASGLITVSLQSNPAAKTAVAVVRDTGIGITPEDLPHVFERFYRAAKDRSRETGGAGLGLAIAQWIARRHGGDLAVDSTVGVGSAFSLTCPLA
ncbi:MAG: heavy metal sensor histidine kinase [Acidobacteria bacterium]|nr:heavy metal sensor histidine kinase [Acidobacteriota bacterium]